MGETNDEPILKVEVELYINPDGSVTFADMAGDMLPVAEALGEEQSQFCKTSVGPK